MKKEKTFKHSLTELYGITNELVKEIQAEGTTEIQKNFLIADLIELTDELIQNNCKGFIRRYGADELDVEELKLIATGPSLWKALQNYDAEYGTHFLSYWNMQQQSYFINEFNSATSETAKFHQLKVCSADESIGENGETILEIKTEDNDFADSFCTSLILEDLINEFEQVDKCGKVIRCLMIGTQAIRTKAILEVLGAEAYEDNERKKVERVKKRFAKFLIKKGFEV